MKFCEKLFCAINVLYIYFLKKYLVCGYGEYDKSYEHESKKCHLKVLSIFFFWNGRTTTRMNHWRFLPLAFNSFLQRVYLLRIATQRVKMLARLLPCLGVTGK